MGCLPYIVDVANSTIVSYSWLILGDGSLSSRMSSFWFGVWTFVIILVFILLENLLKKSLEVMATIGGWAMFGMTILFVVMTGWTLLNGGKIATQPFNLKAFIPDFSLSYFSTTGLLMFAVCGAELVAPYLKRMKEPNRDFRKAMYLIAFMTAFLTVFGTFSLSIFFDANNLPHDLKMNGSYYAFQLLGERMGMGNVLMYIFAIVQAIYMMAQLAVFLDSTSWVLAADTAERFMPKWMRKRNKNDRPIHSYVLTTGLTLFLLLLSGTLPDINAVFNWLLNLNGIVFPFKNCWAVLSLHRRASQTGQISISLCLHQKTKARDCYGELVHVVLLHLCRDVLSATRSGLWDKGLESPIVSELLISRCLIRSRSYHANHVMV